MSKEHRIIREARRLAAENPDFKYETPSRDGVTCLYVHDGQGSCIFGQAMMKTKDITPDIAHRYETVGIDHVIKNLGLRVPSVQRKWAADVQDQQDDGVSWGDAVRYADERLHDA